MSPAKLFGALLILTIAALPPLPSPAQSTPQTTPAPIAYDTQPLPKDPSAALQLASQANGLGAEGLKPWYLKAHYQTYDAKGKPAAKGVFELYWAAKDHYRVSYADDSFTQTIYKNQEGIYRLGDAAEVPYAESQIWKQFIQPVQVSEKALPLLKDETRGSLTETCLEFQAHQSNTNKSLYCLEPNKPLLRISSTNGYITAFNQIRLFQHHFTAGEITVTDYGFPLVTISLDELRGISDLQALIPPADASKIDGAPRASTDAEGISKESVVAGRSLHKAQPYYPVQAKFKGVQGIVRIAATIGKDGLVHDPKVVHNPDDELSEAALKAVSQWTYVPYLLNGQPVEVHTLMNVTFTLAR